VMGVKEETIVTNSHSGETPPTLNTSGTIIPEAVGIESQR